MARAFNSANTEDRGINGRNSNGMPEILGSVVVEMIRTDDRT